MASLLLFLIGVALVVSQPSDQCNFTYNGYNFDLNGMYLPPAQGDYHGTDRDHPTYVYFMNICGAVNVGGPCSTNGAILCQYDNATYVAGPAYQLANPVPQWGLISPAQPNLGVTLTASNGDVCWPTNYPRNVTFTLNCNLEASMDGTFTVWEDSSNDCNYHVDYTHPGACPLPNGLQPIISGNKTAPQALQQNVWAYWYIYVDSTWAELKLTLRQTSDNAGWVGVWARRGAPPTATSFDRYDNTANSQYHEIEIRTTDTGNPLLPGTWYIGVQAQKSYINSFTLQADLMRCPGNCSNNGICNYPTSQTCTCNLGYVNNQIDCSAPTIEATLGQYYPGGIFGNHWIFYRFELTDTMEQELYVIMNRSTQTPASLPTMAIKYQDWPTQTYYDALTRDTSTPSQRWELDIFPPLLQTGVWIVGITGSRDMPFNFTLTANTCDCPKCCSGHGTCNPTSGMCSCSPGYAGLDCSASTIELADDVGVNVTVDPNGGVRYLHITVPAAVALSHVDMEINAENQGSNSTIRVYASPDQVPTQSAYQFMSPLPDVQSPEVVVPHADLQSTSWYIGVWNFNSKSQTVLVTVGYEGWCPCVQGQGYCTEAEPATCICVDKWQGAACDVAISSGSSGGVEVGAVVAMVIIFTLLGVGAGIFLKHKRPEFCERGGGAGSSALVNAD
jgi:hypothetical protein